MACTPLIMRLIVGLFAPHLSWSLHPVLLILGMGSISFGGVWPTLLSEFGGPRDAGKHKKDLSGRGLLWAKTRGLLSFLRGRKRPLYYRYNPDCNIYSKVPRFRYQS